MSEIIRWTKISICIYISYKYLVNESLYSVKQIERKFVFKFKVLSDNLKIGVYQLTAFQL